MSKTDYETAHMKKIISKGSLFCNELIQEMLGINRNVHLSMIGLIPEDGER